MILDLVSLLEDHKKLFPLPLKINRFNGKFLEIKEWELRD